MISVHKHLAIKWNVIHYQRARFSPPFSCTVQQPGLLWPTVPAAEMATELIDFTRGTLRCRCSFKPVIDGNLNQVVNWNSADNFLSQWSILIPNNPQFFLMSGLAPAIISYQFRFKSSFSLIPDPTEPAFIYSTLPFVHLCSNFSFFFSHVICGFSFVPIDRQMCFCFPLVAIDSHRLLMPEGE